MPRDGPSRLVLVASVAMLAAAAFPAHAGAAPKITERPQITGTFTVGGTMTATATWDRGWPTWTWLRCGDDRPRNRDCSEIEGQHTATYTATAEDEGSRLRVWLTVRDDDPYTVPRPPSEAHAVSDPTPWITAAPIIPAPTPAPAPTPTPTPTPAPAPQLLSPFPVVRVRGYVTPRGARVTLLSVQAPKGARVVATCSGGRCPHRRFATIADAVVRLRPFERTLRAGTRLRIRVTQAPFIGKYTSLVMRRGKPPMRRDRCLMPGSNRPVACPSA